MKINVEILSNVVDYIDENLSQNINIDFIDKFAGYSKYNLHRLFSGSIGFPVHEYVKRRRLTEAARLLVTTDKSILDIALNAGYETQQSFSASFKKMLKKSPNVYRKRKEFLPLQLKYKLEETKSLKGDNTMDVQVIDGGKYIILGYGANTAKGLFVIGMCHHKLNAIKDKIENRIDNLFTIGLNDYSNYELQSEKPVFDYLAGVSVPEVSLTHKRMTYKELAPSKYVVFYFKGNAKESMEHVSSYIYKKWFPQSTYVFNENAMYDFIKYGEEVDCEGNNDIEYWVPVF